MQVVYCGVSLSSTSLSSTLKSHKGTAIQVEGGRGTAVQIGGLKCTAVLVDKLYGLGVSKHCPLLSVDCLLMVC